MAGYTVRDQLAADPLQTLQQVRSYGYTHFGFQLARQAPGQDAPPDPSEIADILRVLGLAIGVVRLGFSEPYERQLDLAADIGAEIVALSASPVFFTGPVRGTTTRSVFEAWLPELEAMALAARARGLRLVFHNHAWDHVPLEGATPFELIERRFPPGLVDFEIDIGWTFKAGIDPLPFLQRIAGRIASLHLKDVILDEKGEQVGDFVSPGAGSIGYEKLVPAIDQLTRAVSYVEVDNPKYPMNSARNGALAILTARGEML